MHEISIARELVDLAVEQLHAAGGTRAVAVHVRVGVLAGVVPAALRSAFAAATAGTPLRGARLVVEDVRPRVFCKPCGAEHEVAPPLSRRCAACGAPGETLSAGAELELGALEIG